MLPFILNKSQIEESIVSTIVLPSVNMHRICSYLSIFGFTWLKKEIIREGYFSSHADSCWLWSEVSQVKIYPCFYRAHLSAKSRHQSPIACFSEAPSKCDYTQSSSWSSLCKCRRLLPWEKSLKVAQFPRSRGWEGGMLCVIHINSVGTLQC